MVLNRTENQLSETGAYKVWKDGFHPIEILTSDMLIQKLDYIHQNPVVERVVDESIDYIYSSARQYADEVGELEVEFIICVCQELVKIGTHYKCEQGGLKSRTSIAILIKRSFWSS